MDAGDLIDVEVTNVAHGGVFVARHDGRVVFVSDAIPGERVRVRLTDVRKAAFWRGETLEILDASPDRRPHIWPEADVSRPPQDRPGGADFGHIALDRQRRLKLEVLVDALRRMARLEVPVSIEAALPVLDKAGAVAEETPDGTGWRTRVSLHADDEGNAGPFAVRSHRVVPVTSHPLATSEIEHTALAMRGVAPGRVDLAQPADGRVRVIPRPVDARTGRPRRLRDHEVVVERVGTRDFRVDADGFWQVHRLAAASLHTAVGSALRQLVADGPALDPDAAHLDLYGGVGLFATVLADAAQRPADITTVESDERAAMHAGENLAGWPGVRAVAARVDRYLAQLLAGASAREQARLAAGTVVLDPPRSGAGGDVVRALLRLAPATIVYVACDPIALARDLATLAEGGYALRGLHAHDLFPNSHHVEAVATLTRDGAATLDG